MNTEEIKDAINRYNKRLEEHGISEQALGWGAKGRAKLRYEILLSQWNLDHSSILDFGCGFGDMFDYINEKGFKDVSYTGIDINDNFINIARQRHEKGAEFILGNLFELPTVKTFDFILSSGVFNHKLEN